jgi:integrase
VGEVAGLKIAEVEIRPTGEVIVNFLRTKTRQPRSVPLLLQDAADLAHYLRNDHPQGRTPWAFPSPQGSGRRHITEAAVRTFLTDLGVHLQIPRLHPHAFRHLMATRLLEAGVAERVVQEILGHTSSAVTRDYQHPGEAVMQDALGRARR